MEILGRTTFLVIFFLSFFIIVPAINSQTQGEIPWQTLADSPWPMMSHDPQITGRSPFIGPKTPNILWRVDMPYGILAGPAIGNDETLYIGTNTWMWFFGDSSNFFYAVDPTDGAIKWTFRTLESFAPNSGFLIGADSTIYFGSQGDYIYAVDLEGKLKWYYYVGSTVNQNMMNTDLEGNLYFSAADNYLYSIKRNGLLNWKLSFGAGFFPRSVAISPDGETLYIFDHQANLYALNLDGSIKWTFDCEGGTRQTPTVDNEGNIYILPAGIPATLYSLRPDSTVRWAYELINRNIGDLGSVTIDRNGNIYVTYYTGVPNGYAIISSLDYYGNLRWTYTFEQYGEWITTPLICDADGTIYCGSSWGYYYYAISRDGELLWKLPLEGYMVDNSGAIGSDGTLYIGTHLGAWGQICEKNLIAIRDTVTSVEINYNELLNFNLEQNYPNPFNSTTQIRYAIPESGRVFLKVYDILGTEVATLLDRYQERGEYDVIFQPKNLPSGIYFYTLTSGNYLATKKFILLK